MEWHFYLATDESLLVATCGDFFMAMDNEGLAVGPARGHAKGDVMGCDTLTPRTFDKHRSVQRPVALYAHPGPRPLLTVTATLVTAALADYRALPDVAPLVGPTSAELGAALAALPQARRSRMVRPPFSWGVRYPR